MMKLIAAITLATLIMSPALATPVDAVTIEAAWLIVITGVVTAKYELTQLRPAAPVIAKAM
jgi:hypothetical protein